MLKTGLIALGLCSVTAAAAYVIVDRDGAEEGAAATDRSEPGARARRGRRGRVWSDDGLPPAKEDLEGRVARLERQVESLRAALAMRRHDGGAGDDGVGSAAVDGRAGDGFRDQVRSVLAEEREEREERRADRRRERFEERVEETLTAVAEKAGLNDQQRDKLSAHLENQREQIMGLVRDARGGDRPWGEVRQEIGKVRESGRAGLSEFLDEQQIAALDEIEQDRRGGRGGFGGPPPL